MISRELLSSVDLDGLKGRLSADGIVSGASEKLVCGFDLASRIDPYVRHGVLFSVLVDTGFLNTDAHFGGDDSGKNYREPGIDLWPERAFAIPLGEIGWL